MTTLGVVLLTVVVTLVVVIVGSIGLTWLLMRRTVKNSYDPFPIHPDCRHTVTITNETGTWCRACGVVLKGDPFKAPLPAGFKVSRDGELKITAEEVTE